MGFKLYRGAKRQTDPAERVKGTFAQVLRRGGRGHEVPLYQQQRVFRQHRRASWREVVGDVRDALHIEVPRLLDATHGTSGQIERGKG